MSKAAKDHDAFDASAASLPLDQIICGDNCEVMRQMASESIDLVVTSPPYDDLRTYGGHSWDFYGVAWNLKRLLKPGGVIVWNVNDATIRGSETGSSMRQAIHFQDVGLGLHDTMIWQKTKPTPQEQHPRYQPSWEYMFILSKGYPPRAFNELREPSVHSGKIASSRGHRKENDSFRHAATKRIVVGSTRRRRNVWPMASIGVDGHPAPFPDDLARDHILSWSNPGDVVLDPFSGSGTTAKMAR
jgi:DNA modification methylase